MADSPPSAVTVVDGVHDVLANHRRRSILRYLEARDDAVFFWELTEWLVEHSDRSVEQVDRERISRSLRHQHLPKMAARGIIEYDRDDPRITLTDRGRKVGMIGRFADHTLRDGPEHEERASTDRIEPVRSSPDESSAVEDDSLDGSGPVARDIRDLREAVIRAHDRIDALASDVVARARRRTRADRFDPVSLSTASLSAWTTTDTQSASVTVVDNASITADEARLTELLENVFRNAIVRGGGWTHVQVGTFRDGFYVEDDGPGIPDGERDVLFESGYAAAPLEADFCLAVVRGIARAHGWDASIVEGLSGGTRFEFRTAGG